MKKPFIDDLRITQMVVSATRKRFSLTVSGLALIFSILGFFLIRESQVFISYIFLAVIGIETALFTLFYFEKYMAAQQVAIASLWLLFAFIGISQGDINTMMITGFLMLTIIAGYAFYIRGVIIIMIANILVITLTGWMDTVGLAINKVELLDPRAKIIVSMLFILVGSAYLVTTLEILGRNFKQVREFQRRYQTLFSDSIDAIVIISLDNQILDMNPRGLELTGYTLEEVTRLYGEDLVDDKEGFNQVWDDLKKNHKVSSFEHQIRAKNGELIDVESMPTAVTDENDVVLYTQVHMRDMRSRKRVEEYLTDFKQRYEAMFERAEYGFLLLDMELDIVAANHRAAEIFKVSLSDLHNQPINQILRASSFKQMKNDLAKLEQSGELPPRQYQLVTQKGTNLWVEANIGLVDTNDNQPRYLQWVMRDITEEKSRESHLLNALQEMETLAMTDPLTGLHNRRSIQRYGQIEMENCIQDSKPFCVILIDMDGLKKINDTYGHHAGDHALSQCGQMLTQGKRRDDAVGRWGGDEFLMVLPDTSLHDAEIVAQRIISKINNVQIGQGSHAMSLAVSMGLAGLESRPDEEDLEFAALVDMADQSMYLAKDSKSRQIFVSHQDPQELSS